MEALVLEPGIDDLSSPVYFLSLPITGRVEENPLCAPEPFSHLPMAPKFLDRPQASCSCLLGTDTKEEKWVILQGMLLANKFPGNIPDPRQQAL